MYLNYLLTIITTVLLASGQVLWKIGLMHNSASSNFIINAIKSPFVVLGILIYIVSTLIWFKVLSVSEISKIYPLMSLSYLFVMLAGVYIFKEKVSITNWLGCFLLLISIFLITKK